MTPNSGDSASCGVCGRTILRGEHTRTYVDDQTERIAVCTLCKPRAEAAGLLPEEIAGRGRSGPGLRKRRRGPGLIERLGSRRAAARRPGGDAGASEPEPADAPVPPRPGHLRSAPEPSGSDAPGSRDRARERAGEDGSGDETGSDAEAPDTPGPERTLRIAVELFNGSEGRRKVAGLIRSLGQPLVSVRPTGGSSVAITVAWDLSWYQWKADVSRSAIEEAAQGKEISELSEETREWNARVADDGRLRVTGASEE